MKCKILVEVPKTTYVGADILAKRIIQKIRLELMKANNLVDPIIILKFHPAFPGKLQDKIVFRVATEFPNLGVTTTDRSELFTFAYIKL